MPHTALVESIESLRAEYEARQGRRRIRLEEAQGLGEAGRLPEAEAAYRALVRDERDSAPAWHGLATVLRRSGRNREALDAAVRALQLDVDAARHHYGLGLLMREHDVAAAAGDAYERALGRSSPGGLDAVAADCRAAVERDPSPSNWMRLGNLLVARLELAPALDCYASALRGGRPSPVLCENLSAVHALLGRADQAALWRGFSRFYRGEYDKAIEAFRRFLERERGAADVYAAVGDCCLSSGRYDDALAAYRTGLEQHPASVALYLKTASALHELGRTSESIEVARRGLSRCPDSIVLKHFEYLMLPALYETEAEIRQYRERYAAGLERLIAETDLSKEAHRLEALEAIGTHTNFYLPYQGHNDRELQTRYGQWTARVMAANAPQWSAPLRMPAPAAGGRLRIGYLSAFCFNHAVANIFLGWLRHANHDACDLYGYHVGAPADVVTDDFRRHCDVFRHIPGDVGAIARQVAADRLHVLVYLDIGMAPISTQLASLRLAPVQCATWGHPETSGMPTIDYFISTGLMEPRDGERYYSEALVRLPKIGVSCPRAEAPRHPRTRAQFGLADDEVVYLCCQSSYKYLPQHDRIFVEIARRVPGARFLFVAGHPTAPRLERRIRLAFDAGGIDFDRFVRFLPRQGWLEYLSLMLLSDVFLDTLEWTGCNTSLDAIALGLPVVTCRTDTPRGQYTSAFLTVLGVTDTITASEAEYIDLAVALGLDRERRRRISAALVDHRQNLFDDLEAVRALEAFFARAVEARLRGPHA